MRGNQDSISGPAFWRLATIPYRSPRKAYCVLQVFLDESGKNDDCCVVAGYMGSEKRWTSLSRRWSKVIKDAGVSEFHAKKFWAGFGEFKGWSEDARQDFAGRLLTIIEETDIYPVAAAVYLKKWEELPLIERRFLTGASFRGRKLITTGKPSEKLFLPAHHCFLHPLTYCKAGMKTIFVFDNDAQNRGWACDLYFYLRTKVVSEQQKNMMGRELMPEHSIHSPAIQAADLLAWEVHRYAKEAIKNPKASGRVEYRRAGSKLRDKSDFVFYDSAKIESMLHYFRECYAAGRAM